MSCILLGEEAMRNIFLPQQTCWSINRSEATINREASSNLRGWLWWSIAEEERALLAQWCGSSVHTEDKGDQQATRQGPIISEGSNNSAPAEVVGFDFEGVKCRRRERRVVIRSESEQL